MSADRPGNGGSGWHGLRSRLTRTFIVVSAVTALVTLAVAWLVFNLFDFTVYQPYGMVVTVAAMAGVVALSARLARLAADRVLQPVRRLAAAADQVAHGDLGIRIAVEGDDELSRLVASFNAMTSSLNRNVTQLHRMEAQSRRFVADVSHELRTPLAAMTAVADLLNDGAGDMHGDAATAARLVSQETRNLNELVDNLIEISRFDAHTATLSLDDVDLVTAVHSCLHLRQWSQAVELYLPAEARARIDPPRFDVIVGNLVGNAMRHGRAPVSLGLQVQADWVVVQVSDAGDGIPPDALPYLFDRFYKADTARSRSPGSGLGLAIAAENARLHGGAIEAANRADGGAVFTLRLPLDAAS